MRHRAIDPKIRTANMKAILKGFPSLVETLDRQISAVFALAANGAVDDAYALGPFQVPARITSVTYLSAQAASIGRYFRLYISTDNTTSIIYPTDSNIIDPLSPTDVFVPGLEALTANLALPVHRPNWFLKLTRFKSGSIDFALSVFIQISMRA